MERKIDQWASDPPTGYPGAIAIPSGKQEEGWTNGEEPPAAYFNQAFQALADLQNEVTNVLTGLGGVLDGADLSQLYGALMRQQVKSALSSVKLADDLGAGTLRAIARRPTGNRIVVVGEAGLVARSTGDDGFTTDAADAGFSDIFYDVLYEPSLDLFVAVGDDGEIQTSPGDGTWTQRHTFGTADFRAVASDGAGNLVVVGTAESIWTSSNGIAWANRTSPFGAVTGSQAIVGVAYGLINGVGTYVCVSDQGDIASSINLGVNWTLRQNLGAAVSGGGGPKVAYHPTLGFLYHYDTNVYRSADGVTWSQLHNAANPSTETPGLLVSPYCWMIGRATGATGTAVAGRYSVSTANAATDFRADYIVADGLTTLKVVDGQLMGLAGSKVFMGGVL